MKRLLKTALPRPAWRALRRAWNILLKVEYRAFGRPPFAGETAKARARREREGFFARYCAGRGIDIGFGGDLLAPNCAGWDFEHGDAQKLRGLRAGEFDFVYSSHTLEHMDDVERALGNWWRVLRPGGYLILYLPHRDFYEKKTSLPSRWNPEHRRFFLPDRDEPPDTVGVVPLLQRTLPDCEVVYARACTAGLRATSPDEHSDGEYSIEAVARKRPAAAVSREGAKP